MKPHLEAAISDARYAAAVLAVLAAMERAA